MLALFGVALLILGRRGRLVSAVPNCGACGFDLSGLPLGGPSRCPECGRPLAVKGAIRKGRRGPAPLVIGAGVLLLLASLITGSVGMYVQASRNGVQSLKPVWLLLREARGADEPTADAALSELLERLRTSRLSGQEVVSIVEAALRQQARTAMPWRPTWGDFIETARDARLVDDTRWTRYVRQGFSVSMLSRQRVRSGDTLPVVLLVRSRVGARTNLTLWLSDARLTLGESTFPVREDQPLTLPSWPGDHFEASDAAWGSARQPLLSGLPSGVFTAELPPGEHTLKLGGKIEVNEQGWTHRDPADQGWIDIPLDLAVRITVTRPDETDVTLVADTSLAAKVRGSVSAAPEGLSAERTPEALSLARSAGKVREAYRVRGRITFREPPVTICGDVFIRTPAGEFHAGTVRIRKAEGADGAGSIELIDASVEGPLPLAADIVIRPNPVIARETLDIDAIWGETITMPDVRITLDSRP